MPMTYIPAQIAGYSWLAQVMPTLTKKALREHIAADPQRVSHSADFISRSAFHQDGRKMTLHEAYRAYGPVSLQLATPTGGTVLIEYDGTTVSVR